MFKIVYFLTDGTVSDVVIIDEVDLEVEVTDVDWTNVESMKITRA